MKFICAKANQSEVNADLKARFGETCTRTQILEYRDETGIDPRWIRKNPSCYVARALYRIPGGTADVPLPNAEQSVRLPRLARREKVSGDGERSVLSSPFDDDTYDDVPSDTPEPEDETPKRPRKMKIAAESYADRGLNADGEMPKISYVHAWICDGYKEGCPGRKPGSFHPPENEGPAPKCECGSPMTRHAWSRKVKIF